MVIAKKKVIKVQWDTPIEEIAAILGEKKIKKVPVERKGVLVGIISRGDLIRHVFQICSNYPRRIHKRPQIQKKIKLK